MHNRMRRSIRRKLIGSSRVTSATLFMFALSLVLTVAAACGRGPDGSGVATLHSTATPSIGPNTTTATPSTTSGTQGNAVAFARCMRSHGISDFPDPNSQGLFVMNPGQHPDLDRNSPTFQSASTACESLRPSVSAAQQQQNRTALLQYSQCMRNHGIVDFPDPDSQGLLQVQEDQGGDLDPNNSTFRSAQTACKSLWPNGVPTKGYQP